MGGGTGRPHCVHISGIIVLCNNSWAGISARYSAKWLVLDNGKLWSRCCVCVGGGGGACVCARVCMCMCVCARVRVCVRG